MAPGALRMSPSKNLYTALVSPLAVGSCIAEAVHDFLVVTDLQRCTSYTDLVRHMVFETMTPGLKVRCSTAELMAHNGAP